MRLSHLILALLLHLSNIKNPSCREMYGSGSLFLIEKWIEFDNSTDMDIAESDLR